jgi:hypothetical protein
MPSVVDGVTVSAGVTKLIHNTENVAVEAVADKKIQFLVNGTMEVEIDSGGLEIVNGPLTVTAGGITVTAGVGNFSAAGLRTIQSVANVTEAAPTAAELTAAFGSPATLGRGFVGTVDDNDGDAASVLCWTSDASWYHVVGVKSA